MIKIADIRDTITCGDWIEIMRTWPDKFIHCCVTSPPYWGLRDYGVDGQIGLEKSMDEFVEKMVAGFGEVRRVLRDDGTLWLNMGDSYMGGFPGERDEQRWPKQRAGLKPNFIKQGILPPKNLCGMPWRVALALQADGWYLRQDIIWHKPNPMPESCRDRCTKSHEYIFLLTKQPRYFYDQEAIKEEVTGNAHDRGNGVNPKSMGIPTGWDTRKGSHTKLEGRYKQNSSFSAAVAKKVLNRNKRSVWTVGTQAFSKAHFATFPEKLIEPCILAGTSAKGCCSKCGAPWVRVTEKNRQPTRNVVTSKTEGKTEFEFGNRDPARHVTETKTTGWQAGCKCDGQVVPCIVFDPFMGSGTTAVVAYNNNRNYVGCELNAEYIDMGRVDDEKKNFALFEE